MSAFVSVHASREQGRINKASVLSPKLIRLFIQAERKLKEYINVISVITVINFLFTHINKKDILKTVLEYQRKFTILIIKI